MQSSRFFSFILISPQVVLLLFHFQSFFCLLVFHFLYFLNDMIMQALNSSALHSELAFDRIFLYFWSFIQHLYFLACVLTCSFRLHQTFQLRIPPGPAGNTNLLLSLPKDFENRLAIFAPRLLGHFRNGNTDLYGYLQSFLQFFSKAKPRVRLSSIRTHWPSSSLNEGELCCGNGVFRVLSGHGGDVAVFFPLTLQPSSSACHEVFRLL